MQVLQMLLVLCTARSRFGARDANSYGRASQPRLHRGFSSAPEASKAGSGDDCVNGVFAGLRATAPAAENGQQKSGRGFRAIPPLLLRCLAVGLCRNGLWIVAYKPRIALGRGPPAIRPLWLFGP